MQLDKTYVIRFSHVVTTLLVLDHVVLDGAAAREWDATRLATSFRHARAIKVNVHVPVLRTFDAAAFQPLLLDPINEILAIRIVAIIDDECLEAVRCLRFDLHESMGNKLVSECSYLANSTRAKECTSIADAKKQDARQKAGRYIFRNLPSL